MTSTDTSSVHPDIIERYVQFWNIDPGDKQRALAHRVFSPSVHYRAPLGERVGVDELLALADTFTEQLSGLTMTTRRDPDIHHDCARLEWRLVRDGALFADGTDILTFDSLGTVQSVTTFLDRPPEGFDPHAHH